MQINIIQYALIVPEGFVVIVIHCFQSRNYKKCSLDLYKNYSRCFKKFHYLNILIYKIYNICQ